MPHKLQWRTVAAGFLSLPTLASEGASMVPAGQEEDVWSTVNRQAVPLGDWRYHVSLESMRLDPEVPASSGYDFLVDMLLAAFSDLSAGARVPDRATTAEIQAAAIAAVGAGNWGVARWEYEVASGPQRAIQAYLYRNGLCIDMKVAGDLCAGYLEKLDHVYLHGNASPRVFDMTYFFPHMQAVRGVEGDQVAWDFATDATGAVTLSDRAGDAVRSIELEGPESDRVLRGLLTLVSGSFAVCTIYTRPPTAGGDGFEVLRLYVKSGGPAMVERYVVSKLRRASDANFRIVPVPKARTPDEARPAVFAMFDEFFTARSAREVRESLGFSTSLPAEGEPAALSGTRLTLLIGGAASIGAALLIRRRTRSTAA